jgi:hypothetical protein
MTPPATSIGTLRTSTGTRGGRPCPQLRLPHPLLLHLLPGLGWSPSRGNMISSIIGTGIQRISTGMVALRRHRLQGHKPIRLISFFQHPLKCLLYHATSAVLYCNWRRSVTIMANITLGIAVPTKPNVGSAPETRFVSGIHRLGPRMNCRVENPLVIAVRQPQRISAHDSPCPSRHTAPSDRGRRRILPLRPTLHWLL